MTTDEIRNYLNGKLNERGALRRFADLAGLKQNTLFKIAKNSIKEPGHNIALKIIQAIEIEKEEQD